MNSIFLLDLAETVEKLNDRVEKFLNDNYQNPLFWVLLCVFLFSMAAWAIGYFNKN